MPPPSSYARVCPRASRSSRPYCPSNHRSRAVVAPAPAFSELKDHDAAAAIVSASSQLEKLDTRMQAIEEKVDRLAALENKLDTVLAALSTAVPASQL